jgi:hypothetical protein
MSERQKVQEQLARYVRATDQRDGIGSLADSSCPRSGRSLVRNGGNHQLIFATVPAIASCPTNLPIDVYAFYRRCHIFCPITLVALTWLSVSRGGDE